MFRILFALVAFLITSSIAVAQVALGPVKVGSTTHAHATIGTSAAVAIAPASVVPGLLGWQLCADAGNTNTVIVGKAVDPASDGMVLAANMCFVCQNCSMATLKAINVKGGAAAQGYSVVQFK